MPSTLDVINEVRKKYGQLPIQNTGGLYNADGYTNNNDLGTLAGAFGIGTANMANNTLVGGTGYGLGNLGRFVEWLSPFSGETITPNDRRALANIGYNAEQINQLAPYEDSWITSGAKGVLSAHNAIEDSLNDWRAELLGDNPTTLAKMAEGSGSSIGYMLAALALGTTPLGSSLIAGAGEALSEAGGFMGDAYRNGQYDNGALSAANKGFAANAVLNTGLNYLLSPFGKIAGKIENPVARYLVGTGTETLNELLQEPSQQVIEQAATNSLNNGTGFMSELGESVKQLPEIFPQLAPEVAGSTLMTQALLAPMGIKANYAYNQGLENVKGRVNAIDERMANIPQNEETQKLIEDRNAVFNTINKLGYNNNWKGLNQSLIHLNNLENAINNYGKSSEEIQAEKQAETIAQDTATQQPTMEASPLSPIVPPEQTQHEPLPDEILQPLLDKYRRIQSLIDDKLQIPNTSNINKEQEELTDLFTKLNRIDNAINNGDIIEANSILSEGQSKNEPITIETANINQLKAEHDRLQELYESKLEEQNHHNSPQLQEELKSLLDNLDTVDNAIKERERQANIDLLSPMPLENSDTQQNNIPSMDDLWSMVEQNQDNNHYDNDYDYGENSDYDNYDYDKEDNNISSNIEAEEQNNHSETTSEEQLRQDFKQQAMNVGRSEDEAEAESHLFIAMNKSLAKYAGLSLEKYIKADNLSIVYTPKIDDVKGHNVQARTEFSPEKRNIFGDIEQEAQTIIRVSKLANQSSIIHEMGHIFLRKLQRLAQSGQLKGVAEQDWKVLLKNYGISKLDFNNMSDADLRAWTDTHEKFATDFERYMMTGEAPSSKMKHIFEQFKRWLTNIYHSIQDIKYVGSDGQAHSFELSPEMKEVFDHLLGGNEKKQSYNQTVNNDIELNNKKLLFTGRPTPAISSGSNMNLARASSNMPGKYAAKGDLSQKQSFNEILRSDTESVNNSDIESYNQIIGEQGAKRLDEQEGVTTRMDYLSIAKEMEEADKENKVIRYATGWERGKDGKWRYEIMDRDIDNAKIYENMEQNDIPFTMKLSDVYKNEELLTAYPSLKDIDVKFTDELENGTRGQFEGKRIKLSTDYSINSIRSTLIHEIQHAIQNIEGFLSGGNPEQFIPETDAPRKRFQKELDSLDKRSGIEKLRQKLQKKVINGELQLEDAEKEIEKARKNSPYDNLYAKLQDEVMQHEEWLKKKYKGNTKPYDIYRSLAGEVEARNAQARMDLTKKERKNTLLSDTEDVNRDRQIENYNQAIAADDEDDESISVQEQIDAVRKQYEGTDKWLKAPNGKKSNLNEKQWLQVRTPNFKRWFGNWEAPTIKERLTNGDMVSIQDNGNELIKGQESIWHDLVEAYSKNQQGAPKQLLEFLRPLIPETITNVNIGDIGFTNNSLRNSLHHKNGKANATVLPYIKEILESAEYIGSRNIEAKRTSYILAKPLLYDGQRFIMLMVVNEDTQGKKYYDHEFTTIKKIDGLPTVLRKSKTTEGGQNHQSLLSILAEDVWFNNASKVVDENGEPLVVYHGTNENFSIFEHDKIGESSGDYGYLGYGFYFTPNEGEAWMYGTIKMPVFLNIKNPFRCDFADLEKYSNILSFDENDKNNIIDKEKLISALESKSPVAKDFFQELEKNGYEKACENIIQKYSDEEIKQSPIDFNNVVEYWEYAQGKIEVPYYVAEDIIAELGEDIIKREYVETPHLKELLNYGKNKSQTQEFIKALKKDGYDGVIYGDEHVIFNSEQAKSATDNTGTFNSNNPDIYYQAFSPRKSLIQRLKDWIKGKGIEERERLFSSADATNNTDYSFDNEESERRWEEAKKGIQQPTAPQRIKRATLNLLRSFRGDYPELAGNKEFNFAREAFRKLGRAKSTQVHKSMKTFTENLGKLSKRQLDLFARKRLLDDLMWRKQQVPDAELPFGFTDESLKKEYEKFTKIAESDKAVMKAIHDEEQTMQAISKEFADLAGKLGLNLDKVFKNPHYFRHSILEYANAAAVGTKNGKSSQNTEITNNGSLQNAINSKLNDIRNRSFLKKYKGSNLDINMNYAQAMGEVRAQMLMDIETMKTLLEIKEHYDKAPELREALKKAFTPLKGKNESHNQGDGVKLSEIIPEGYTLYNPAGSRLIQSANTTAENVLAMAIDDASEESGLPLDEIINSMGTTGEEFFNQLWIIPKEIKETLRKMSKGRDRGLLGNTARVITRGWKKLVLFSPTRNLKYNFRNFTGDLDAVIAGNPSALKFFGQSVKELTAYFTGKEITQDLKDYMERSGGMEIESMSFSDNEVKELQSLAEILKDKSSSIPKKGWNLIKKFFANEVAFTQWREHLLRYAAYLAYKQDMDANNGIPSTWGASIKDEVMSLDNVMTRSLNDNRDKAYKMSNELLGAYDQVSDTGKQLRETLIPFYSWMEVNMRRYYRLLKNGFSGQNSSDFTKRLLLGQTAIVPFYALSIAETTAKIAALTLAVQMFNRMFFGDDDDKLPNDVKYRPHLTLGEIGGKVYYFDRIGALADATDWLSLDSIFLDAKELVNGQQSIGGYLKKIAQAPVNKIINGLNPILKMPIELATGRTMYPDAFNSRTIRDNEKYIAQSLGLAWPYKALVTGEPRNDWDELSRMLIYSLDPDEAAYFQTLDKVRQFQERVLDKKFDGFATTRRGKVLQNLKRALRYKDKAAIRRYLKEYAKVDGTKKGLQQSMKAMSPLFGLSKDEKKQFLKWITADDRKYLRRADKYFRELTSRFLR